MGRLEGRVVRLEAASQERAILRIKELFESITDRALALILAEAKGVRLTAQQEQERASAEAKLQAAEVEGLLWLAVRPERCVGEEQIDRKLRGVMERAVLTDVRRERLSLLVRELEEQAGRSRGLTRPNRRGD